MSSVSVITGIIILLAALVCYAFAAQGIQHRRERRKRLLALLKTQSRSFKFILNGCPEGFLTKELKLIVLRGLIEISDQLSTLEPTVPTYSQDLELFTNKLSEVQRQNTATTRTSLTSLQQAKEVKMSLEELHRYVMNQESANRINRSHADAYRTQIKQLVLQVTVDAYILNGQSAMQQDKTKLALHYFDLAHKLLIREAKPGMFDSKIAMLGERCRELKKQLDTMQTPEPVAEDEETQAELDEQWDKFSSDDEGIWQKKQIYD